MVHNEFTPEKQARFLRELASRGIISHAATRVGISRRCAYDHRGSDPDFAAAWDEAIEIAAGILEAEAHRRAVKGVLEPVFYQGAQCGAVRKYSDTLLIFLLKAHDPERFRDNVAVQHTGKGGGKIQFEHTLADLEELLKLDPRDLARRHSEALSQSGGAQPES